MGIGEDQSMIEEISEHFQQYDISQLEGATNTIKGKMFEILITNQENTDSDNWSAKMHEDESFPGSDIIFMNSETNETLEVSLKAISYCVTLLDWTLYNKLNIIIIIIKTIVRIIYI